MNGRKSNGKDPSGSRADLAARLRAQAPAIQAAIFSRIRDISEPVNDRGSAYAAGLRGAISDAVDLSIENIEQTPELPSHLPPGILSQARLAAREGVRLDTVMRRYTAGNKVLEDFILEAATNVPDTIIRQVLNDQGIQVERVMAEASDAYRDELVRAQRPAAKRRADRIGHLLEGKVRVPPADLDYDFDHWNVGIILSGRGATAAGRLIAERLGCKSLHGEPEEDVVWIWLGSMRQPSRADIVRSAHEQIPARISVAIGEPRKGLEGWKLTHREAEAALQVMWQRSDRVTCGRDVILLAAVLRDETLVRCLLDTYLAPIEEQGNGFDAIFETLRAFFSSGWNAAAASEALEVDRHTISQRIKRVEKILGEPLDACSAELQVALQIAELKKSVGQVADGAQPLSSDR